MCCLAYHMLLQLVNAGQCMHHRHCGVVMSCIPIGFLFRPLWQKSDEYDVCFEIAVRHDERAPVAEWATTLQIDSLI